MGRRSTPPIALALAALLPVMACSSFSKGTAVDQLPAPLPERDQVKAWRGGASHRLHAVTVDAGALLLILAPLVAIAVIVRGFSGQG